MKTKRIFILSFFLSALVFLSSACDDNSSNPPNEVKKAPFIDKIEPVSGNVGDPIKIYGKYFGDSRGSSSVEFAGKPAASSDYTSWSDTLINMKVPVNAQSGEVRVRVGDSLSNPAYFTLGTSSAKPFISTVKPSVAAPGDPIEILGFNFLSVRGSNYVDFGGVRPQASDYISWGNSKIKVKVPQNAPGGKIQLKAVVNGKSSNVFSFTVTQKEEIKYPHIDYISPTKAEVGDIVKIYGSNFREPRKTTQYEGYVVVSGVRVPDDKYYQWTDSLIQIYVPEGASSGKIVVFVDTLKSNEVDFELGKKETPAPVIDSLSLTKAQRGQSIDIYGKYFGDQFTADRYVSLAGAQISRSNTPYWSDTQITIVVPQDATSGNVEVTVAGKKSNAVYLEILQARKYLIDMVEIKAGSFTMGSNNGDEWDWFYPAHRVVLTRDFYMGKYEVTQEEWSKVFMGSDPSYYDDKGANNPVNQVNWRRVVEWCNAASKRDGFDSCYTFQGDKVVCDFSKNGYRLPTEAEWEYAARAGTTGNYSFDGNIDDYAWTRNNSQTKVHRVGSKLPNPWGLYDMYGNVAEWCWDWLDNYSSESQTDPVGPAESQGNGKVIRGGSAFSTPNECYSFSREDASPEMGDRKIGFRVVRTITK